MSSSSKKFLTVHQVNCYAFHNHKEHELSAERVLYVSKEMFLYMQVCPVMI
jgi:hypothetical protein